MRFIYTSNTVHGEVSFMKVIARFGFFVLCATQFYPFGFAESGIITTMAGPPMTLNGATAISQGIEAPIAVASDGTGGFYVACSGQNQVYYVTADGKILLAAGSGIPGFSGDGGPAASAQLNRPEGVAVDAAGNLNIADTGNQRIRRVTVGGIIDTIAGNGTKGFDWNLSGQATSMKLNEPMGIAVDASGNLFIADSGNHCIRKVIPSGALSTIAGTGTAGFNEDESDASKNKAKNAQLTHPTGVAVDLNGNLVIADSGNNRIRKIASGIISTVAGNGNSGFSGDGGSATSAQLHLPNSVTVDMAGNLYISDSYNFRIRKVTPGGVISTIAGQGTAGFSGDGGLATSAQLYLPMGISLDASDNLYIADYVNRRIREVASDGLINTVAGIGTQGFSGDGGPATLAQLHLPTGVSSDGTGNLFIADSNNSRIRKVTPNGIINTVAGNGIAGFGGDGGPATSAQLNQPIGVTLDVAGNLFISDSANQRIRKVTPDGVISTVAGKGTPGFSGDGGAAIVAQLNQPGGIAVDSIGNLFIADVVNNRIREVTPDGVIHTVAGMGGAAFGGDGGRATFALLHSPAGVAIDTKGNIVIADSGNNRIREVTTDGVIRTVAGIGAAGFNGDGGPAIAAAMNWPTAIAVDSTGNLFISDHNNRIRKVTSDGIITTIAGIGTAGFSGDEGWAISAQLNLPMGIAVDAAGNLFIADYDNNRIREVISDNSSVNYFPQVAIGSSYSTYFTVTNTSSTAASGMLILKDPQGNPLSAKGTLTDALGKIQVSSLGYTFPFMIPAGGKCYLSLEGLDPMDAAKAGWGQLITTMGSLAVVASYEYAANSTMRTTTDILPSQLLQDATIAVDNDSSQGKQVAYAIANPGSQSISIDLALVDQDGTVIIDTMNVTLDPGQQIATYLCKDLTAANFRGSLVLRSQRGASFVAVAMLDTQGSLLEIPMVPGNTDHLLVTKPSDRIQHRTFLHN
jgi:sugar lactone lactonase YvrE